MELKNKLKEGVKIFEISGRLDSAHSRELNSQIMESIEKGIKKILIDLHELTYISSAGIRVLVQCHKEIEKLQGELFLVNLPKPIENVLYITGFSPYFKTYSSQEEALKKLSER